ncbi:MAG: molybdenum cofactor biosynthesis protein MoaE, partial [Planctomycetes bacterium]|nr:molybdenum cofactor biosynthesis protein MoaE [Planctomycetota bacterium]
MTVRLTENTIDYYAVTESVRSNRAGAVVLFLGTVREFTDQKQTTALDYDAYHDMALAKLQELVDEASVKWPLIDAVIEHRVGHLELGEVCVAVAVSSPHRRDAFEAGQFLILLRDLYGHFIG